MLVSTGYNEAEFSRDVIARWGHLDDSLAYDQGRLHPQMAHLGGLCKENRAIAAEVFDFLEGLLQRADATSEIENAVATSFLDWSEVQELGLVDTMPKRLKQVIEDQAKRYEELTRDA
jgi:hypothetical protein